MEHPEIADGGAIVDRFFKIITFSEFDPHVEEMTNRLRDEVHEANVAAGWWNDLKTGADLHPDSMNPEKASRNVGELLCLVHSEVSEAYDAWLNGELAFCDDKLPHRSGFEVELADAAIRIFDLAGGLRLNIGRAVALIGSGPLIGHRDHVPHSIAILHRYISAAMECSRKGRSGMDLSLAGALVTIGRIHIDLKLNVGSAFIEKLAFNKTRPDHRPENRRKEGGKAF